MLEILFKQVYNIVIIGGLPMGKILRDEKAYRFFEQIQHSEEDSTNVMEMVQAVITEVAADMHIGRFEAQFSIPKSKLRPVAVNATKVLYAGSDVEDEAQLVLPFTTGDGGNATFRCYAVQDYVWGEEELRELCILGRAIYGVFGRDAMRGMLKRTMLMDLNTGIFNITGFMKFAEPLFAKGENSAYDAFFVNVHNFRYVNKVLPYGRGDEVIKLYAHKLENAMGEGECVARLGGDNFVALVRRENVTQFLSFVKQMEIAYDVDGQTKKFRFGATVGAAHLEGVSHPGEMMNNISIAYQIARKREISGVVYYNNDICQEVMAQKEIIAGFERALAENEFVVYYQPKVTTENKQICGAEALVRWFTSEGMVPPMAFIPLLERDNSICRLDFYILDKVCEMLDRCRKAGLPMVRVSVNFSRKHMEDVDFVKNIIATIDRYGVPHEYLEVELTESDNYRDYGVMSGIINALKTEGIATSIDDFGTGYSSLNMLKMTNVDLLKIDKSLVPMDENSTEKKRDMLMFESIVRMAKGLGIDIIAEGVETQEQYEYLKNVGCDMIQGYYFDRPLPEQDFLERLCKGHY